LFKTIYPDFQNVTGLWAGIITSELEPSDLAVYRRDCDIVVVKRNESGSYNDFASYQIASSDCYWKFLITYTSLAFNGAWVAVVSSPIVGRNATSLLLLKLEPNGTISEAQLPNTQRINFSFGRFLSDGALVGIASKINDIYGNSLSIPALLTFKLLNSTWTLVDVFYFTRNLYVSAGENAESSSSYPPVTLPTFVLTDTLFIATDRTNIYFYERQGNNSWLQIDAVPVVGGRPTSLSWNGVDTLLLGAGQSDAVTMYIKADNGSWSNTTTRLADLGYNANAAFFGLATAAVNANTFLVLAPFGDSADDATPGRVVAIQKYESTWYLTGQIVAPFANAFRFFPYNIAITDRDILFSNPSRGIYRIPRCMVEPLDRVCAKQVSFSTCNVTTSNFDPQLICNFTQSECISGVTATVLGIQASNSVLTVDFELNRWGSRPQLESVTMECGTNAPASNPTSATVPVIATPSDIGKVTSDAQVTLLTTLHVLAVAGYLLLN
jgi:hypothetical protein